MKKKMICSWINHTHLEELEWEYKKTHIQIEKYIHTHTQQKKKLWKNYQKKKMKNEMWGDNLFTQCINTKQIFFLREIQWPQWAFSIYLRFQLRTLTHTHNHRPSCILHTKYTWISSAEVIGTRTMNLCSIKGRIAKEREKFKQKLAKVLENHETLWKFWDVQGNSNSLEIWGNSCGNSEDLVENLKILWKIWRSSGNSLKILRNLPEVHRTSCIFSKTNKNPFLQRLPLGFPPNWP